jgi:hypothetical protein
MIYTSENNWYTWNYKGQELFGRQSSNLKFNINYNKFGNEIYDLKIELDRAAASTLDHYPGLRPCVFFSGGVDSELILRAYINIGANPNVFIIRYENDLNIYDVSYAITICNLLDVKYNLIDFNLEKFYENDAESISDQAQIDIPKMLPHLKFTDCADGVAIVGHYGSAWTRLDKDYSEKSKWVLRNFEWGIGSNKYNILHNRAAIHQWWHWTPGLILSYTKLKWFNQLINDNFDGKLGFNSTKLLGFQEVYPDLLPRKKYIGFEKIPEVITEFENYLSKKNNGLIYRQEVDTTLEELTEEILGNKL